MCVDGNSGITEFRILARSTSPARYPNAVYLIRALPCVPYRIRLANGALCEALSQCES